MSDLLQSVRLLHADFAVINVAQARGFALHNRRSVTLHLVLNGTLLFEFPDVDEVLEVSAGQYIFAPTGFRHRFGSTASATIETIEHFAEQHSLDRPHILSAENPRTVATLLSAAIEIDPTRHETLVRLIPEIRAYRKRNGPTLFDGRALLNLDGIHDLVDQPGASAVLLMLAEMLLANATRLSLLPGVSPADGIATPDSPQIAIVLRLIHEHPERHWSVAELAREAGMSRTVFAEAFHDRLGETPIHYLKRVRMDRAKALLRDGARSLPEIAHLSGYDSEAAFARAFKRDFGATPGRFRRDARTS